MRHASPTILAGEASDGGDDLPARVERHVGEQVGAL
jgi:hypothetical protein